MTIAEDQGLALRVQNAIQIVGDFPRQGIRFRDISPVVESDPDLFRAVIDSIADFGRTVGLGCIAGIESWGLVFASPVAYVLSSRLCLVRRPGTLPRQTATLSYDMSYAQGRSLAIQGGAMRPGDRVLVVDDVLASGGTALAAIDLLEDAGALCIGVACLAAFPNWGAKRLADRGVPVHAVAAL
jgi:adenine phosphoribosyltransferase